MHHAGRHVAPPGQMAHEFGAGIRFVSPFAALPENDVDDDVSYVDEYQHAPPPREPSPPGLPLPCVAL